MADMDWLLRRSREVARELDALPDWERALLRAQLVEPGNLRNGAEPSPAVDERPAPAGTRNA